MGWWLGPLKARGKPGAQRWVVDSSSHSTDLTALFKRNQESAHQVEGLGGASGSVLDVVVGVGGWSV